MSVNVWFKQISRFLTIERCYLLSSSVDSSNTGTINKFKYLIYLLVRRSYLYGTVRGWTSSSRTSSPFNRTHLNWSRDRKEARTRAAAVSAVSLVPNVLSNIQLVRPSRMQPCVWQVWQQPGGHSPIERQWISFPFVGAEIPLCRAGECDLRLQKELHCSSSQLQYEHVHVCMPEQIVSHILLRVHGVRA